MLYTPGKHYRKLVKDLRNCIISKNLEISKEVRAKTSYRYFTHIYLDDKLIPVEIEIRTFTEEICILFWHDFVPKDRLNLIYRLIEEINAMIWYRRFYVDEKKADDNHVSFFINFPVIDTSLDKRLFKKTFAHAIACCKIFFPLISNAIESGNNVVASGDWEKAISDYEKIRMKPFIR